MSFARIKETFFRLPKHTKFIGIGALILVISTLLPWYADLDSYKIGDEFLGITGPASFVGIVILLLSGLSLWIFSYRFFERHVPRLPVREAILHIFVAVESLFLLLLVNSIFFHPKFGVNITLKESRFGMTFAIIGAIILLIGGYLQNREEITARDETGRLEPLIKLEPRPSLSEATSLTRPHGATLYKSQTQSAPTIRERPHATIIPPAPPQRNPIPHAKGFLFGEGTSAIKRVEPPAPQAEKGEKPGEEKKPGGGSYMYRTDL